MSRPLIVVHANCADGFACRWLLFKHFGGTADYVDVQYGDPIPDVTGRPHVLIADFSWKKPQMLELCRQLAGGRLTVLDHHKSAEEELADFATAAGETGVKASVLFDRKRAGCQMVWRYLKDSGADNPVFATHEPPTMIQYVGNRDRWDWSLDRAAEVCAYVDSYPKNYHTWDVLHGILKQFHGDTQARTDVLTAGEAILRQQQIDIDRSVKAAVMMTVYGEGVWVVNTPQLISEVGNALCQGRAFSLTYYDDLKRGLRICSLRSSENGGADVSQLARSMGGGGHARAAGFELPVNTPISTLATRPPAMPF
jgi:oligoribonuclease NrnB/cAMP/cGMP phosphodiesterase (DHH superfamily)